MTRHVPPPASADTPATATIERTARAEPHRRANGAARTAPPTPAAPPSPAPRPERVDGDRVGALLETCALALDAGALGMSVLTAASMALLGPFGFLPALTIGPLVLMGEVAAWLAERRAAAPAIQAVSAAPSGASCPPAATPTSASTRTRARPTLRTSLRRELLAVQEAHHTLPTLLTAVESAREPLQQLLHLQALRRYLEEHFQAEEAPLGLFEELRLLDPRVEDDLGRLCDEHAAILADLAALTDLASLEDPRQVAALPSQAQVLERLRGHQRNEDALVQQVYGFQVGGDLEA